MRSLSDDQVVDDHSDQTDVDTTARSRRDRRAYRHGAAFVRDWRLHCRALDRNTIARIMFLAEALERRTKKLGRRNGIVSVVGLMVLRVLVNRFLNKSNGLCCPGYEAIRKHTGLCRSAVATALARLETCGILKITRRLTRNHVRRVSPITGLPEDYVGTTNATNLYAIHAPGAYADHLETPPARPTPFPSRRKVTLLEQGKLYWSPKLSLRGGEKLQTPVFPMPGSAWGTQESGSPRVNSQEGSGSIDAAVLAERSAPTVKMDRLYQPSCRNELMRG